MNHNKRVSNVNQSVEKVKRGNKTEYVVTRAVTIDGKRYKSEHRSGSKSLAERHAKEDLSRQVSNDHEEMAVSARDFDNTFGEPTDITPSQMRHSSGDDPAEGSFDHMNFDDANIEGQGPVKPSDMEGYDPEMEDQFSLGNQNGDPPVDESGWRQNPYGPPGEMINEDGMVVKYSPEEQRALDEEMAAADVTVPKLESTGDKETTVIQKSIKQPRDTNTQKHFRTEKQRNHVPWTETAQGKLDGRGEVRLKEPNPQYFTRPGEKWIHAENNAGILLGRDRAPTNQQVFSKNISSRDYTSGYSDYMTAGAIDIVAGRMAPYPLESVGVKKIVLKPSFNTSFPPEVQGVPLENGQHPGMVMDAARIYISQMTNIDVNFQINVNMSTVKDNLSSPNDSRWSKRKVAPTSGIMVKADKVRLHSRQDLKIVTGGPFELYNSLGNPIRQNNGIHLIAENGIDKNGNLLPQQPMVLGNNLVKVLEHYGLLIEDAVQAMDAMAATQMTFNQIIATNFDLLPIPSGTTIPNPFKQLAGVVTQLEMLIRTRFGALFQLINNFGTKTTYLSDMATNDNFILSRFNTVN